MRHTKNLLDDSLSSISFEEQNPSQSEASEKSPSPIVLVQQENLSKHSSPSTSIKGNTMRNEKKPNFSVNI